MPPVISPSLAQMEGIGFDGGGGLFLFCPLCCKGIKPFSCSGCDGRQLHFINAAGAAAFVFEVLSWPLDQPRSQLLCLAGFGFCHSQSRAIP